MSVLIKHMAMPKGCIYANDKDQTEYCPLLNYDDVPFCQYIENEPEIAIGIDERPVYCPLSDVPEPCQDVVSRQAAIDALEQIFDRCEEIEAHLPEGDPDRTGYKMYPDYLTVWKYLHQLPPAQPEPEKYEYHYDHTDCIWYRPEARNRCPTTCAQYRDGWNDAMNYIFRDGKGYRPYRRDNKYEG